MKNKRKLSQNRLFLKRGLFILMLHSRERN